MKRILVTGATGNVGRQVVSQLLTTDVQVRALTRDPASANLPDGVEVRRGDLTVPETLDACLDGVDVVFLVWTSPPDRLNSCGADRQIRPPDRVLIIAAPDTSPFISAAESTRGDARGNRTVD